ncbi:hypothetical protein IF2G_03033 [Cordyceps javanica]|nr:hypothetical protein IF2G_03033 [Cordyceps javanica]
MTSQWRSKRAAGCCVTEHAVWTPRYYFTNKILSQALKDLSGDVPPSTDKLSALLPKIQYTVLRTLHRVWFQFRAGLSCIDSKT